MEHDWIREKTFEYLTPCGLPPICIRTVYMFYQKKDVLLTVPEFSLPVFRNVAFITVGFRPSPEIIGEIKVIFSNARFCLVFGNGLDGRVLACRVSLWLKGLDAGFSILSQRVHFTFHMVEFSCPEPVFSFNSFRKITGFRTNVRCPVVMNNAIL